MTDSTLRSLERHASLDPSAEERLIVERIRAGGRDPRVDPRAGDEVGLDSAYAIAYPESPADAARLGTRGFQLGWEVLAVEVRGYDRPSIDHDRRVTSWRAWARAKSGDAWVAYVVEAREPETRPDPALAVEAVEWTHRALGPGYRREGQRSSIDLWRRWARRGRVLRVAP